MSPADQTSAPKWKNRKVGLTVKDLTYEIRNAMQLSKNAPGVMRRPADPSGDPN